MAASVELVQQAQQYRPALRAAIVVTRRKPRTTLGREIRRGLEATGLPLLAAELCDREAYRGALMTGMSLAAYAPQDAAVQEVRLLCDELLGKEPRRRAS